MKKKRKSLLRLLLFIPAAFLYAAGVSLFLDPNDIAPGGITGLAILLSRFIPIATGTWILLLNIPILILGIYKLGLTLVASTIYMLAWITFFTNICSYYMVPLTNDRLISALIGGALVAIGIGTAFRFDATTGGVDIIVKVLRLKFRHLKSGILFLMIDFIIVILAGIVFGNIEAAAYALIAVFTCSTVLDKLLYGQDEAKLVILISNQAEKITPRFLNELDIGVTFLNGNGAYSNQNKKIILCAIRKQLAPRAIQIVRAEDENAFLIVASANEIFGEGYKSYSSLDKY